MVKWSRLCIFRRDAVLLRRVGGTVVIIDGMISLFHYLLRTGETVKLLLGFLDRQAQLSMGRHYGQ